MDQNVIHHSEPVDIMKPPTSPGAFAVECAICHKWRYIPTKEKYEEIREHILEHPFYCKTAREWNSNKNCDNPPDLTQDKSGLKWAIDMPNIAKPPPRWERLIKFRPKEGIRLADVYYDSPSGKRLRSKNEVEKYLEHHPEDAAHVKLQNFSFQIPRPLQEDYVKKRQLADVYYDSPSEEKLRSKKEVERYLEQHPQDATHVKLKNFSCQIPRTLQEDYVKECLPGPSHDVNGAYNGKKRYKIKIIRSKMN